MPACPCESGKSYDACCGPLHDGETAGTAEQLMRSRYSAYARGDHEYLLATWHPRTRPDRLELYASGTTRWLGLSIRRSEDTAPGHAIVEFIARYRVGGAPATRLHEISRFVREDGRWYYVDGAFPAQ